MKNNIIIPIVLFIVLSSCNKERIDVYVIINSNFLKSNKVVIDDTLVLKNIAPTDSFTNIVLKSGEHQLTVNGNSKQDFMLGEKGGLLNLDKREYVILPIKYSTNDWLSNSSFTMDYPIIIDSLIIYEKWAKTQDELLDIIKNSNMKEAIQMNLAKIDKDQLYIEKVWDYGLYDVLPESIDSEGTVEFKKQIMYSLTFLIYAELSDQYHVEKIKNKEIISIMDKLKKFNIPALK
jgi:hypothetical protein